LKKIQEDAKNDYGEERLVSLRCDMELGINLALKNEHKKAKSKFNEAYN